MTDDVNGWVTSTLAWIAEMGREGDFGRRHVLDAPMLERVRRFRPAKALDVGCGEGRFCRMLAAEGVRAIGIDPVAGMIAEARRHDRAGDYRIARAEALPFEDASFDLVVSYLTLIDVDDLEAAISETARVLAPGGVVLIANLTSFATANPHHGWIDGRDGTRLFPIDNYLDERAEPVSWRGIAVTNWHRPLSRYMALLLDAGLRLTHFSEPEPTGGEPEKADRYRRVPMFIVMEWQQPVGAR